MLYKTKVHKEFRVASCEAIFLFNSKVFTGSVWLLVMQIPFGCVSHICVIPSLLMQTLSKQRNEGKTQQPVNHFQWRACRPS